MAAIPGPAEHLTPIVKLEPGLRPDEEEDIRSLEKKAMNSAACLKHMKTTLEADTDKDTAPWVDIFLTDIAKAFAPSKGCQTYIGLRGATGAGKSTILNSLIRHKDFVPTNSSQACTAVPIEVGYNWDDEKDPFRAEVYFATKEEWNDELEALFRDLELYFHDKEDPEAEEDFVLKGRITDMLSKLKYVYPHLKSIDDLRATSRTALLEDENVYKVLSSIRTIYKSSSKAFSSAIRIYTATQESDGKAFAHWPLVTCVKLFLKAEILKSGLVLVDLPGGMDSNAARRGVAEKYQKKLAVTCVVADVKRASDDQEAHLLLDDILKRDLQMDGLYNSDSLCFVISQCDRDYDMLNYLEQNPSLKAELRQTVSESRGSARRALKLKEKVKDAQDVYNANMREIEKIQAEIEELKHKNGLSTGRKRKRNRDSISADTTPPDILDEKATRENITKLQKAIVKPRRIADDAAKNQWTLSQALESLNHKWSDCQNILAKRCNGHRCAKLIATIQEDFENTRKDIGFASTTPLPVFCVSATTYLHYLSSRPLRRYGFPDISATQIPALREFLVGFTRPTRVNSANSMIMNTQAVIKSMQGFIDGWSGHAKLSDPEMVQLAPSLHIKTTAFEEKFSTLGRHTAAAASHLVRAEIFSKMPEVERQAAAHSRDTITRFGNDNSWNTYRAINRYKGVWIVTKKKSGIIVKNHRWNDELFQDYSSLLVRTWDEVFFTRLPQIIESHTARARELVNEFILTVTDTDNALTPSMKLELEAVLSKMGTLLELKMPELQTFVKFAIRECHRDVGSPAIQEYQTPIYLKCSTARGKNHFKASKAAHKEHITNSGAMMHRNASIAITKALNLFLKDTETKISDTHDEIIGWLENVVEEFLEGNRSPNSKYPKLRNTASRNRSDLKNSLKRDIAALNSALEEEVIFKPDEQEDLSGFEYEQDDKYGLHADPDYVDDEDADDDD